jgi:large subunit ribosomal protein L29
MAKVKKMPELRALDAKELKGREQDLADKLFNFRLKRSVGQLDKPSKMREAKRDLARVLTALREKRAES